MVPPSAPSETMRSAVPSAFASKLVMDRPLGKIGCAVCLVSKATLPKNFAIAKSVNFWQHCETSVDKIVNVSILRVHQI
jgi:hypothetical protein